MNQRLIRFLSLATLALAACRTTGSQDILSEDERSQRGLIVRASPSDFASTVRNARDAIVARGLRIMAEVDHAANARGIADLPPTHLFIFGNPKAGTALMLDARATGIDLPMKLLVWEDATGETRVAYNDPNWIAERHGIDELEPLLTKMSGALGAIAGAAVQ